VNPEGGGRPHMGLDRGSHLGQRLCGRAQAGHMSAVEPPVRILIPLLHPKGRWKY
jgi:hypothetical protein